MISLYDDQAETINGLRSVWKGHKRILLQAPTGAGKTRMAAKVIEGYVSRGKRVCFTVPRTSLIQQTADSFMSLGLPEPTLLWQDMPVNENALITIASIDTYIRRAKGDYDLTILDECHKKRRQLLEWMNDFADDRYLGLTATPFADWMGEYFTEMVKSKPMRWLMENNRLSKYDVYIPSKPDLSGCKTTNTAWGKDYKESDIEDVMCGYKLVGDVVGNWVENGGNRMTMVLCVNKAHAGLLLREFKQVGTPAELITAEVKTEERRAIYRRCRDGITKVLLSIDCLTEGFDMPECDCLINARPTKSKARFIQGMGRVLRYMKGKRAIIFDHAGSFVDPELGRPEYIEIDDLLKKDDGLSKPEKLEKEIEKLEKVEKECKKCNFLKPAGVHTCPQCGHEPIHGEDVDTDITRQLVELCDSLEKSKPKEYTKEDKQRWWSSLLGYQYDQGLKGKTVSDGRIAHIYKDKFGVWPRGLMQKPSPAMPEVLSYIKAKNIRYAKSKKRRNGNKNDLAYGKTVLSEINEMLDNN